MLLTISTTHKPATDLGFLLHKHPDRFQSFDLSFGKAHVFYPTNDENECTVCLLLDVDPIGLVRKNRNQNFLLSQYVNDRPYVASSFMSVAITKVFGSAKAGRCKDRPDLANTAIPLCAKIDVLPVRGGEKFLRRIFGPLGYTLNAKRCPLDEKFPQWGESPYYSVTLHGEQKLSELLSHLYVLVPIFDDRKHYYVGDDEIEKLLAQGEGWLPNHPEKEEITRRYLRYQSSLVRPALARLMEDDSPQNDFHREDSIAVESPEKTPNLNAQRHEAVVDELLASGAQRVLDLGCSEGKLLRSLLKERQFKQVVGVDVAVRPLEIAHKRLKIDRLPPKQAERIQLLHGSLIYRDKRLAGFDAAAVVEVIEHLDPPRLAAFERVLFEFANPKSIILTTPNREYNVKWESLPAGAFRHTDHRFEWTRNEFQTWSQRVASEHNYHVRFKPVGPEDATLGAPTQMAIFAYVGGTP